MLPMEQIFFLVPTASACWKHICKPLDWNVIPSEPASFHECFCLKQTEEECSLPRFYFRNQKLVEKVEKNDWSTLLIALNENMSFAKRGIVNRMSKDEILRAIKEKIGVTKEEEDTLVQNSDKNNSADVGNEWDELVLDDLDPEDKPEFRELKEAIEAKRFEQFQEQYEIIKQSMTVKRRRGRPKKEKEEQKARKGNMKVNTKWIRRKLRPKRPLHDEAKQETKKQKTSSAADQSEDAENVENPEEIQPAPEFSLDVEDASAHTAQMTEAKNEGIAPLSNNEDIVSELASRNEGIVPLSNNEDIASELASRNEGIVPVSNNEDIASELASPSTQAAEPAASLEIVVAPGPSEASAAPRSPGAASQISMNSRPGRDIRLVWQSV